nr:PREDICTED: uncharacterized protein LOC105664027 [Megachile rotundata]
MAPKRRNICDAPSDIKPKRIRGVLTISEKVNILDMIEVHKKSYAEIARLYGKNESSIREVMKNREKIRASFSVAPQTAKVTAVARNKVLMKMEKALNYWVEDMSSKGIPVDGNVVRKKALNLYEDYQKEVERGEEVKPFTASKGWLHRFKKRFNFSNIKVLDAPSPDKEEEALPTELGKFAAGNPRDFENKNKFLSVLWQYNLKAWVTSVLFTQWFQQCFMPEIRKYLDKEPSKISSIIDPSQNGFDEHDQTIFSAINNTSQMEHKASHARQVFETVRAAIDANSNLQDNWKSFTTADAIDIKALYDLKPEMINTFLKNPFLEVDGEVKKIIETAREINGEGFGGMMAEEVEVQPEVIIKEEMEDVESYTEEENEEEIERKPALWTMEKLDEVFRIAENLSEKIREYDPIVDRSVKVTQTIKEALQPIQEVFNELRSQEQQLPGGFYHGNEAKSVSGLGEPQPSTSFATNLMQTPFPSSQSSEDNPDN